MLKQRIKAQQLPQLRRDLKMILQKNKTTRMILSVAQKVPT